MSTEYLPHDPDLRPAVGAPVERPVRPSLSEALDAWWEAAYAEGRDGRTHDTEGGAAQQALQDIWAAHQAALVAAVAAERERIDDLLRTHQGVSLATLEYLETMRQGPTADEWAELDRN